MPFSSFCFLPPEYGLQGGKITFLEDCPIENLKRYYTLPMIADQYRKFGIHPRVCCPEYLSPQHICTPSDAWCPTYSVSLHIDCLQLRLPHLTVTVCFSVSLLHPSLTFPPPTPCAWCICLRWQRRAALPTGPTPTCQSSVT